MQDNLTRALNLAVDIKWGVSLGISETDPAVYTDQEAFSALCGDDEAEEVWEMVNIDEIA